MTREPFWPWHEGYDDIPDEDELEAHARATQQAAWSYNFHRQDKCHRCAPHDWHGVACEAPTGPQPCPCPTAWSAAS